MRRLTGIVGRMERRLAPGGCALCKGHGWPRTELLERTDADSDSHPPALRSASGGCPCCGKVYLIKQIILEPRPAGGAA